MVSLTFACDVLCLPSTCDGSLTNNSVYNFEQLISCPALGVFVEFDYSLSSGVLLMPTFVSSVFKNNYINCPHHLLQCSVIII